MVFTVLLYFIGLPVRDMIGADEPREAGIGVEMALNGNLVVPKLNGAAFLEKPPFFYWLQVFCYNLFGVSPLTARLPAVLSALGGVAVVFWTAVAMGFGPLSAFLSGFILALAPQYWLNGRICMVDSTLTALIAAAIYCFFRSVRSGTRLDRVTWMLLFAAALNGAVLTKGLIGLAVPLPALVCWLAGGDLLRRRIAWANWLLLGLGSLLGLVGPGLWAWQLYLEAGWTEGISVILDNNFGRFLGNHVDCHAEPFYYYFKKLGEFFQPWLLLVPFSVWWHARRLKTGRGSGHLLLLCWSLLPFLLLLAASGKRMVYLLPLCPALALLTGTFLAAVLEGRIYPINQFRVKPVQLLRWGAAGWGPLLFLASIGLVAAAHLLQVSLKTMIPPALVALALASVMIYFERRGDYERFFITALLQFVMVFGCVSIMAARYVNQRQSFRPLFANTAHKVADGREVILYNAEERIRGAAVFYLQRRFTELRRPAELAELLHRPSSRRFVILANAREKLAGFKPVYQVTIRKDMFVLAEPEKKP